MPVREEGGGMICIGCGEDRELSEVVTYDLGGIPSEEGEGVMLCMECSEFLILCYRHVDGSSSRGYVWRNGHGFEFLAIEAKKYLEEVGLPPARIEVKDKDGNTIKVIGEKSPAEDGEH